MSISRMFLLRKRVVEAVILPLLLWCLDVPVLAAMPRQDEVKIAIRTVEVKSGFIVVTYELVAPASESYEVSLVLLKEGNASFKVPVRSASGDIGEGKFSGTSRQVRWEYAKDYAGELAGDGYYFEITVTKVSGSNLLYYIGLGGLAVVGGAVALLAGGKKAETSTSSTSSELPTPPGRPSQ
jgi:hypothetical protein